MKSLRKYRFLTLWVGIATAMVIIFSQLFYFQAATYCQKKADTEQHNQKEKGTEAYISIPSSSISSVSHIEIHQALSFVIETLFENEKKSEVTSVEAPLAGRLFQTLFRFIIAPNAP